MPVIAVVVGAIGTAVGTAVGAAIGGTILGVSVATIGGVIGAGLAGGVLAYATGGSFGQGFLMGAAGAAVGGFLKAGLGDAVGGATQFADGTTTAGMLAEQGGAIMDAGGNIIEGLDVASAMGDMSAGAMGAETFGIGETAMPTGTPLEVATPTTEQGLQGLGNVDQFGGSMGEGSNLATSAGFNAPPTPSLGSDQFSMLPDSADTNSFLSNADSSYAPASTGTEGVTSTAGGLESIGQASPTTGVETAPVQPQAQAEQGLGGTVKGMFKSSDAWLKNTLGQSAPSTGKLLMGGGQYLMDQYNINKQERMAKGLAPMSFDQYKTQFTNPDDYRNASASLAQSGRTGTLPALLARMNERARQGYANYLPGAKEKQYEVNAGIQANRNASLSRLFSGLGYGV